MAFMFLSCLFLYVPFTLNSKPLFLRLIISDQLFESMDKKVSRIAVLTSGGDAPGMNAAVRAVVRTGNYYGLEVYGVMRGFQGLIEDDIMRMDNRSVANIIQRGGTGRPNSLCPCSAA